MMASAGLLAWLVGIAVAVVAVSPVILIVLLVQDRKGGQLW